MIKFQRFSGVVHGRARTMTCIAAIGCLAVFGGCAKKSAPAVAKGGAPMEVGVVTVTPRPYTLTRELPGRTSAYRIAEVRARVSGIVLKRLFEEGSEVTEGQPLYTIDPAPYQAALDSAKAGLARAEARYVSAKLQADRYDALFKASAISRQELEDVEAALQVALADVAAGKAAVQTASINLEYTQVFSPISGRIGSSQVTEGAYVQSGQATLLATVQQIDRLYVDVNQASTEVLRLRKALQSGVLHSAGQGEGETRVTLLLEDGSTYSHAGTLQFADITVEASTGTVRVRALVPNPQRELLPGMFVRARIEEGVNPSAILVPQQGISRNQRGQATAMVVSGEDKAEMRVLTAEHAIGNAWLVTAGLKAGDRVIVQNLQRIRPGSAVTPVQATNLEPAQSSASNTR